MICRQFRLHTPLYGHSLVQRNNLNTTTSQQESTVQPKPKERPTDKHEKQLPSRPKATELKKAEFQALVDAWKTQLPHEVDPELKDVPQAASRMNSWATKGLWSNEMVVSIQRKYDYSWGAFRRWRHEQLRNTEDHYQRFIPDRHAILGPDLATAHFIINRTGRVKFEGFTEWITELDQLPHTFDEEWVIEKVDASGCRLVWNGLDNLANLYRLNHLNMTGNQILDTWGYDKVYRMYRFSNHLRYINFTNCSGFNNHCLENVHRIPSLEEVVITGTPAASYKYLDLVIIMLQDVNPKLKIII